MSFQKQPQREEVKKDRTRRGSSILEFALVGSFIFIPLLLGTTTVGMAVLTSIQAVGLNRDAGHMFASGVDFSTAASVALLQKIAGASLNNLSSTGNAVVILSEIQGTGAGTGAVCTRQFVIGNAALHGSSFASPSASATGTDTNGYIQNLSDPTAAVADTGGLLDQLGMVQGQVNYIAETYVSTTSFGWSTALTSNGIYVKAIF